jgi:lysozyme
MRAFKPLFLIVTAVALSGAAATQLTGCSDKVTKSNQCDDDKSELQMCGSRQGMVKGIDVSAANGEIDWAAVKKAGIGWAYAQVSDGLTDDERFGENWKGMKTAGLTRGAYQYFHPSQDPTKQAQLFLKALKENGKIGVGDLPPVLDLEETTDENNKPIAGKEIVAAAKEWLDLVEKETGRKPMIMTTTTMMKVIGLGLKSYPLWIAQYRNDCPDVAANLKSWSWDFWTYSAKLKVSGVENPVLSAFFQGTATDLKQFTNEISLDGGALGDGGGAATPDGGGVTPPKDGGTSTKDSGASAKDSGGGTALDSGAGGGGTDSGGGGTQVDGGSSGGGNDPGIDNGGDTSTPPSPPPAKGGPRAQREEPTKDDPCAPKDDPSGN